MVGGIFMGESTDARQAILAEVRAVIDKFNLPQASNYKRSPIRLMVQGADSIDHVSVCFLNQSTIYDFFAITDT